MLVPTSYPSPEMHKAMAENTEKLVTPMDVFETLVQVGSRQQPTAKAAAARAWASDLFNVQLPDRNCKDTGLGPNACPCDSWNDTIPSLRRW